MASIFEKLSTKYRKMVQETGAATWTKDNLISLLQSSIDIHQTLAQQLKSMSDKEMQDWYVNHVQPALQATPSKAMRVYDDYRKYLSGGAQAEERKRPFASLAKANELYAALLTSILKKLDQLVETETVDLENVRISSLSILGLLKQSHRVVDFTTYLYTFFVRIVSGTANSLPKYREAFLLTNYQTVASLVSDLIDKKGIYLFLSAIEESRRKQTDVVMKAFTNQDFTAVRVGEAIMKSTVGASVLAALAAVTSIFFIGKYGPELLNDFCLFWHNKRKETKQWMEAHTAMLRIQLNATDPSDPKYNKLLSIIKVYDDKIAEYDKRIAEFEADEE